MALEDDLSAAREQQLLDEEKIAFARGLGTLTIQRSDAKTVFTPALLALLHSAEIAAGGRRYFEDISPQDSTVTALEQDEGAATTA